MAAMDGRMRLADDFAKIYRHEWRSAQKSLGPHKHDEEIIYLLMRIVRAGYDFCMDIVTDKRQGASASRTDNNKGQATSAGHKDNVADKRHATSATDTITEEFTRHSQQSLLIEDHLTKELHSYIHKCIDIVLQMCSSNNQLTISWIPKGDPVNPEMFVIEGTGSVCDWTVWPAVLDPDGKLLQKGVIIPVV